MACLRGFPYERVDVCVHSDPRLMPREPRHWTSINLIQREQLDASVGLFLPPFRCSVSLFSLFLVSFFRFLTVRRLKGQGGGRADGTGEGQA